MFLQAFWHQLLSLLTLLLLSRCSLLVAAIELLLLVVLIRWVLDTAKPVNRALRGIRCFESLYGVDRFRRSPCGSI